MNIMQGHTGQELGPLSNLANNKHDFCSWEKLLSWFKVKGIYEKLCLNKMTSFHV